MNFHNRENEMDNPYENTHLHVREPGMIKSPKENGNYVSIVTELPGAEEENVRLELEDDILIVSWSDSVMHENKKEFRLPHGMQLYRKKFENGFLEIILAREPDSS